MPIDEALDKLEGSEKEEGSKKKKKSEAKSADLNEQLLIDAQKCLGEWLAGSYFSAEAKEHKSLVSFLKNVAPYALKITPEEPSPHSRDSVNLNFLFTGNISAKLWHFCLSKVNDYIAQTDIILNETAKEIDVYKEAKECLPELRLVEKKILNTKSFGKGILIEPYLIPMAMSPEHRPLIAVTIRDSLSERIIEMPTEQSQRFDVVSDLIKYTPSLDQVADNAKKYKITELRKIVRELDRALDEYKQKWAWR